MYSMRKILVIGCPGSGKSVFSIKLSEVLGVPVYHLDNLKWNPDGTTVDRSLFLRRLEEVLEKKSWIIDGNYGSTMEQRMKVCDTIIFLDYDLETCLGGVNSRRGTKRPDMPWVEPKDHVDEDFLDFIRNYKKDSKPEVLRLLEKYEDKVIMTFRSRDEASEFLETLEMDLRVELVSDNGEYQVEALRLIKDFWKEHNNLIQTEKETLEDYRNWTKKGHRLFLIRYEESFIGFAHLGSRGATMDWLEDIYVKDEYQGKGIGSRVISYLEEYVKTYSESLYIEVAARNLKALHLYKRLGYDYLNTLTIRKDFHENKEEVLQKVDIAGFDLEIRGPKSQ